MKRNILFYITYYPGYGGIEKVTTYLANYLCEQDLNVSILSFKNNADELKCRLSNQVGLYFVPDSENLLSVTNQKYINNFLEQQQFDWIIYQDCYSPIHQLLFRADTDITDKLIVCEHSSPNCRLIAYRNSWKQLSWFNFHDFIRKVYYPYKYCNIYKASSARHRLLLNYSNKYILLSETLKKEINFQVGYRYDEKIIAISNPVTSSQEPDTFYEKKKQILFVGRLVQDKGISYLLDIWTEIEKQKKEWNLVIVGDGPLRSFMEQTIQTRNLQRIKLEGAQMNVEDYYKESSILMMTSVFEGFGLVLVEAMSKSVVPIAFNSFATLQDIIDNNINGFIIKPYNISQYITKLSYILNDTNLLNKMSKAAKEKSEIFAIRQIGKKWIDLIRKL